MPGAYFKQLRGQWLFQGDQHAWTGFLFTAEGALMSHKGCYGLFEPTLLYFRRQIGWICHRGTEDQPESQKVQAKSVYYTFLWTSGTCEYRWYRKCQHSSGLSRVKQTLEIIWKGFLSEVGCMYTLYLKLGVTDSDTLKHQIWHGCGTDTWGDSVVLPHVLPSGAFCGNAWLPAPHTHLCTWVHAHAHGRKEASLSVAPAADLLLLAGIWSCKLFFVEFTKETNLKREWGNSLKK